MSPSWRWCGGVWADEGLVGHHGNGEQVWATVGFVGYFGGGGGSYVCNQLIVNIYNFSKSYF